MFYLIEIFEIIITIIAAGYILQPLVKESTKKAFFLAGASIVLHELGHKFVAVASGFNAVYHANYSGLALGIILRFFSLPLFFVPAYVSISGSGSVIGYFFTALAGPLTNLSIYGICTLLLTKFSGKDFVIDNAKFINSLRLINMWLGIFNLLPIPGTDGFNALVSLQSL